MTPLYARVLGSRWSELPEALQQMHDVASEVVASGLADIDRGPGIGARLLAAVVGFPRAGRDVPVTVRLRRDRYGGELWQREFAGRRFRSAQFAEGEVPQAPVVMERFGPITMALRLDVSPGRLDIVPIGWRCLGVPLPVPLMPVGETFETVDGEGRFVFHVEIAQRWLGLIVRYRGHLVRHR